MRFDKGHKEQTRRRIVETAARRFRKEGVEAVGIAGLMADAGLTHGGFYAHFASKEELVRAALEEASDQSRELRAVLLEKGENLEALVRSLTERSMRMQVRFEVVEGLDELPTQYRDQLRSDNPVVQSLDRLRLATWKQKEQSGFYLTPRLHSYFCWDPRVHHEATETGAGKKLGKLTGSRSASATA